MPLLGNSTKIRKELFSVILTKSLIFSNKKWEINGKLSKKINSWKFHKLLNSLKNTKTQQKLINSLKHKTRSNRRKSFCMIALKSFLKLKETWTIWSPKAKTCQKGQNSFTKPARKWIKNVVNSFDLFFDISLL